MFIKQALMLSLCVLVMGCGKDEPPQRILAKVNDYTITLEEFQQGFERSAYAARVDKKQARRAYLDKLVSHKLILQDAQTKDIDKDPEFLRSIERFWEQSLLTVAIGMKNKELGARLSVPEELIRRLYEQMLEAGLTEKTYEEMYPQIKWQAAKQMEAQMLTNWMASLQDDAEIDINENLLKALDKGESHE